MPRGAAQAPQWIHCDEVGNVKVVAADRQKLVKELKVGAPGPTVPCLPPDPVGVRDAVSEGSKRHPALHGCCGVTPAHGA